ncbi:hypothetical protein CDD83_9215 [Cordyceps sp. RAO-2017]|nr:hypothetical protein CDD83_9215 [Cordyceps sp. RAO-2017]
MVHATPNMFRTGHEVTVPAGIIWLQFMAWAQVPRDYAAPSKINTEKKTLHIGLKKAYEAKPWRFFRETETTIRKFDQFAANAEERPQLMGSSKPRVELTIFIKQNGEAVKFSGKFPLFKAPEVITDKDSAADNQAEPAPHEEGVLEEAWGFTKAHPVAVALLSAVVALNLIPGLSKAAKVAEFSALSSEAVTTSELAAEGTSIVGEAVFEDGVAEAVPEAVPDGVAEELPGEDTELGLPDVPTHEIKA